MKHLLTAAERFALRSPDPGRLMNKTVRAGEPTRCFGGVRYGTLKLGSPHIRRGRPLPSDVLSPVMGVTLAKRPRCRGCGQLVEPGSSLIRFDFRPAESTWEPREAWLHADKCPSVQGCNPVDVDLS